VFLVLLYSKVGYKKCQKKYKFIKPQGRTMYRRRNLDSDFVVERKRVAAYVHVSTDVEEQL